MPAWLDGQRKLVMHILPIVSFELASQFDVGVLMRQRLRLIPINAQGANPHYNFDGVIATESNVNHFGSYGYVQIFRNGIIESVDTSLLSLGYPNIPSIELEREMKIALKSYMDILRDLSVSPPVYIKVSMLNVFGCKIEPYSSIDRHNLIIPEILLDSFERDASLILKPIFDIIWNACGAEGSLNYN